MVEMCVRSSHMSYEIIYVSLNGQYFGGFAIYIPARPPSKIYYSLCITHSSRYTIICFVLCNSNTLSYYHTVVVVLLVVSSLSLGISNAHTLVVVVDPTTWVIIVVVAVLHYERKRR